MSPAEIAADFAAYACRRAREALLELSGNCTAADLPAHVEELCRRWERTRAAELADAFRYDPNQLRAPDGTFMAGGWRPPAGTHAKKNRGPKAAAYARKKARLRLNRLKRKLKEMKEEKAAADKHPTEVVNDILKKREEAP